jgi:SAM-dependent methyltransferase
MTVTKLLQVVLPVAILATGLCVIYNITFKDDNGNDRQAQQLSDLSPSSSSLSAAPAAASSFRSAAGLVDTAPECGKICSYDFDARRADAKFYPLLQKRVNCTNILRRMIRPPYPVVKPPPRDPPPELVADYTQNGQCPIKNYSRYMDDSGTGQARVFTAKQFNEWLWQEKVRNVNTYGDNNVVQPTLTRYIDQIKDKHVLVIGTLKPWAEAMLINRGARKVTTAEYNPLTVEHPRVETITPSRLAERFVADSATAGNSPELFDTAFSYSSLEHTGIGRYGDPLMPFGDLEAVAQVWCMLKPGGLFFLAVPVSKNRKKCKYLWNAHRVYGVARLQHLTANWEVLDDQTTGDRYHALFVLRKISDL